MQLVVCLLLSQSAFAGSNSWECKADDGAWSDIILTAAGNIETNTGTLDVAGTTHETQYDVTGFQRNWAFYGLGG